MGRPKKSDKTDAQRRRRKTGTRLATKKIRQRVDDWLRDRRLVMRIREGDETAAWEMVSNYTAFAKRKSHDIRMSGFRRVKPDDAMQQALLGLHEAACRFDPDRGPTFMVYSAWWIYNSIQRYAHTCESTVKVTHDARTLATRLERGEELTETERRRATKAAQAMSPKTFDFDSVFGREACREVTPLDKYLRHESVARLRAAVERLEPVLRIVIEMGALGNSTQGEISAWLHENGYDDEPVSISAINWRKTKAVAQLRQMLEED